MRIQTDVAIIGAGYYGCYATYKLAQQYPHLKFTLVESESEVCTRASSTNQGQFHRGYMYTAKPKLALECSEYAKEFEKEFGQAIDTSVKSYYGLHEDSIISPEQFEATCALASLPLELQTGPKGLFGPEVAAIYATEEKSINTSEMRKIMRIRLFLANVNTIYSTYVKRVKKNEKSLELICNGGTVIEAKQVINATFAGINKLHENSGIALIPTRNDVFLHFMIKLPSRYKNIAATVAVGNYCSLIPSQYRGSHLLAVAGVRSIATSIDAAPNEIVRNDLARELFEQCQETCSTWMPVLKEAELVGFTVGTRTEYRDPLTNISMSEVKVINNHDDIDGYSVLLGGKISCLSECVEPLSRQINARFALPSSLVKHPILN